MDDYLEYLVRKYFIFKSEDVQIIIGNEIDNIDLLSEFRGVGKSDICYINMTNKILEKYVCLEIDINIDINKRICVAKGEEIYLHYKKYKSSAVRETETYLELDNMINTIKTEYVDSVDMSTDELKRCFGDYVLTGMATDNFRYEYKFNFIMGGKKYIFSLYDYLNTDDKFDDECDIYWHVASNTKKSEIIKKFKSMLNEKIEISRDSDCC